MNDTVDLRSDTVTRPTPEMRRVMASADVGDDVFGEDPSILKLEERVAALAGKEAAVFVPSGTMANQIALRVHTRHGDSVIAPPGAHVFAFEGGGGAALAGVQFDVTRSWRVTGPCIDYLARTGENPHYSPTALVWLENTHNRAGGRVLEAEEVGEVGRKAKKKGLAVHIDGARLWNAVAAGAGTLASFAQHVDTVSLCMSKGLGAPVGSLLVGGHSDIAVARRFRKMYGGGMRQAGMLAAAADFALTHHLAGLAQDHANAKAVAEALDIEGVTVTPPESNILIFELERGLAAKVVEFSQQQDVLCLALSSTSIRLVFHHQVSATMAARAAEVLRQGIQFAQRLDED